MHDDGRLHTVNPAILLTIFNLICFQLYIVPKTRVVKMTSPTFFYPKRCCSAREEVRPKIGSYQVLHYLGRSFI